MRYKKRRREDSEQEEKCKPFFCPQTYSFIFGAFSSALSEAEYIAAIGVAFQLSAIEVLQVYPPPPNTQGKRRSAGRRRRGGRRREKKEKEKKEKK